METNWKHPAIPNVSLPVDYDTKQIKKDIHGLRTPSFFQEHLISIIVAIVIVVIFLVAIYVYITRRSSGKKKTEPEDVSNLPEGVNIEELNRLKNLRIQRETKPKTKAPPVQEKAPPVQEKAPPVQEKAPPVKEKAEPKKDESEKASKECDLDDVDKFIDKVIMTQK
jgi:type IV secretory pathway VirB10-like protein